MGKQIYQNRATDEFIVKVATMPKKIFKLLETGFDHIMTKDNLAYSEREHEAKKQWMLPKITG